MKEKSEEQSSAAPSVLSVAIWCSLCWLMESTSSAVAPMSVLGLYLKRNLPDVPAGIGNRLRKRDQVAIPVCADKLYLGWLFHRLTEPRRYFPRHWAARKLLLLMVRYRSDLPALKA